MSVLLDTNILTRSAQPHHTQHQTVVSAVAILTERRKTLCLAPQNLYEFWVVATRPLNENGLGLSTPNGKARLDDLERSFTVLDETPEFRKKWAELIVKFDVKGKTAHDARLVAAMRIYGIHQILTLNAQDFARYQDITVLKPGEVVQSAESQKPQ
jgi:predicted nucleic acid-binding protein